jgi:two-component system response regulator RegA
MSGGDHPPSLLIVDDDQTFRERLARALVRRGYEVRTAANFDEAVALSEEESAELAVVDLRMPGRSGLDVLRELKRIDPSTKVVMLTGYGSIATTVDAMRLGAVNYLPKPADADDIIRAFERSEGAGPSGDPPLGSEAEPEAQAIKAPTLARAEWEHIHRVLADCGGNISEAARRLGIHRRSLQRKLQKFAP